MNTLTLNIEQTKTFKEILDIHQDKRRMEDPIEDLGELLSEFYGRWKDNYFTINSDGTVTIKMEDHQKPKTTEVNGVVFKLVNFGDDYLLLNQDRPVHLSSVYESNNIYFMSDCVVHIGHEDVDVYNLVTGKSSQKTFR